MSRSISESERATVLTQLDRMLDNGKVKNFICQRLVSRSVYWYGHPQGPTKAPKHSEHVINGGIEFGANRFFVAGAVQTMIESVRMILEMGPKKFPAGDLMSMFKSSVSKNVQDYNGNFYIDYPHEDGYMHFGSQAIHIGEFAREFFDLAKCHLITY